MLAMARVSVNTYVRLLKDCARKKSLAGGTRTHSHICRTGGLPLTTFLGNALMAMYARCRRAEEVQRLFYGMPERDVFSWNTLILTYASQEESVAALLEQMLREGMAPNKFTYVALLKVCGTLEWGKRLHTGLSVDGFATDATVGNALIDMYARCGSMVDSERAFRGIHKRTIVSWTAMIAGFHRHGRDEEAMALFQEMEQQQQQPEEEEGVKPDAVTFAVALTACATLHALYRGKYVHVSALKSDLTGNIFVGTALVDMYAKCGSLHESRAFFDTMCVRNTISWTAMIAGCIHCKRGNDAIALFTQMQEEGIEPDEATYVNALQACVLLVALHLGKRIHTIISKKGLESHVIVGSALIDMYAKCGSVEDARQVFNGMGHKNVVSWNTMIAGYSQHGQAQEALALFKLMQEEDDVKPDGVTFVSVLSACSHAGLFDEGYRLYEFLTQDHDITLTAEHSACIVDLLGRLGLLVEAEEFINKMTTRPDLAVWTTLLDACRRHGNVELGRAYLRKHSSIETRRHCQSSQVMNTAQMQLL